MMIMSFISDCKCSLWSVALWLILNWLCLVSDGRTYMPKSPRIHKGHVAAEGEVPWIVSMQMHYQSLDQPNLMRSRHACNGAIIHPRWVLSVGHCVQALRADMFDLRYGSLRHASGGAVLNLTHTFVHPGFVEGKLGHDIGLVRLEEPGIRMDSNHPPLLAYPVMLPASDVASEPPVGATMYVAGWGISVRGETASPVLRATRVRVMDHDLCQRQWFDFLNGNGTLENPDYYNRTLASIPLSEFCAEQMVYPVTASNGTVTRETGRVAKRDSGGPGTVVVHDRLGSGHVLVGLLARGNHCTDCETVRPFIYTRVASYLGWIRGHMGRDWPP